MRQLQLFAIFLAFQLNAGAQNSLQLKNWFYNLPIDKEITELKKVIARDSNFKSLTKPDTSSVLITKGIKINTGFDQFTFLGKIVKPNLPHQLIPDSALIELTFGFNSGEVKILSFEYFIKDSLTLEKLFDTASSQLKKGCKQTNKSTFGIEGKMDSGKGIELIYPTNSKKLRKFSIYKKIYLTGAKSLLIEFEAAN